MSKGRAQEGGSLEPGNNPGNARWCEAHNRMECIRLRKNREQCHGPAIRGTSNCRTHAGKKTAVAVAQGQARITAWNATGRPEGGQIDSGMAVLGVLHMSWLRLAAYGELLRRQAALEGDYADTSTDLDSPESSGLIGHRYGMGGKEGISYVQSEEIRALVVLEAAERDRVVKYAKTAHDMGISDRLTSLAERWGDVVVTRIMTILGALELTEEQQTLVPALIQAHLGSIDVGGTEE